MSSPVNRHLLQTLTTLTDTSLKSSRHLDDTYYSLLERAATCRQTIGSLQELANLTNELHGNFEADTKELAEDMQAQFEAFCGFEAQMGLVGELEERIKKGRERADGLGVRLEEARRRVEERKERERELEVRNTRRCSLCSALLWVTEYSELRGCVVLTEDTGHMRILWSIIGAILGLVMLSIVFQQLRPVHPDTGHTPALDFVSREQILNAPIPDIAKEAIMRPNKDKEPLDVRIQSPSAKASAGLPDTDHRLRAFDEL